MISGQYEPRVFNVTDLTDAKKIILTPDPDQNISTDIRWEYETPYFVNLIGSKIAINSNTGILDFGCGVGRISKPLIEQYGCRIIGTDISRSMRALSEVYVDNDNYFSVPPKALKGFRGQFDLVIAVWVLQHVFNLNEEINLIKSVLKPGGKLFVINEQQRMVPTNKGWINDSVDQFVALQSAFKTVEINTMDPAEISPDTANRTFFGIFENEICSN